MSPRIRSRFTTLFLGCWVSAFAPANDAWSQSQEAIVQLSNGMTIGPGMRGTVPGVDTSSKSAAALNSEVNARPVTVIDDNLRLTFFRTSQIQSINNRLETLTSLETKNADLRASGTHPRVIAVLSTAGVTLLTTLVAVSIRLRQPMVLPISSKGLPRSRPAICASKV